MRNARRLLELRGQPRAAELLRSFPFAVMDATNHFGDDFSILHATVSLEQYVNLDHQVLRNRNTRTRVRLLSLRRTSPRQAPIR
jgi:hypothetical protein